MTKARLPILKRVTTAQRLAMKTASVTRPWAGWFLSIAATCFSFAAMTAFGPRFVVAPLAAYLFAFVAVAGSTLLTSWRVPVTSGRGLWVLAFSASTLAWVATEPESPIAPAVVLTALLAGATVTGAVIGSRVQFAGHMIFVAIVSSAADIFSVFATLGPTAAIVEQPMALNLMVLPWPLLGTPDVAPILGVGDVVFASLYRSAARAHGLSSGRTMSAMILAFTMTLATLLWVEVPIPALPFFGLAYVLAHPEARRVPERDRRQGWIAVVGLLLLLGALSRYRL